MIGLVGWGVISAGAEFNVTRQSVVSARAAASSVVATHCASLDIDSVTGCTVATALESLQVKAGITNASPPLRRSTAASHSARVTLVKVAVRPFADVQRSARNVSSAAEAAFAGSRPEARWRPMAAAKRLASVNGG